MSKPYINEHPIVSTKNSPYLCVFILYKNTYFTIELVYVTIMSKPCNEHYNASNKTSHIFICFVSNKNTYL